jgi:S1-C subfamily serine protease
MAKKLFFLLLVIIISGISGILADRFIFPRLAASRFFSRYEFLKKAADNVTIINKTEQVYVKEESSINKITNQAISSVVNIISYSEKNPTIPKNGTGTIVTSDGIIMTYFSTINQENSKYKIMLFDGNIYDAELIGVDSWSNLAFLKINAGNLPVVSFGNSDDYKPGEKVIAIGNDFSHYQNRFTAGLLNGFNPTYNISEKALPVSEKMEGVFLTDFSSESLPVGGPIVDYSGQTIGIIGVTVKDGKKEYFEIPSNKIKIILKKVVKKEFSSNPELGIYFISLNKSYALANNIETKQGSMIFSPSGQQGLAVIFNTPAAKAGLKIYDIITKINDEEISLSNNISDILYRYKKGDELKFTVVRNRKEMEIFVQL